MNRIERLTGIILVLQRGRQTAAQLAERFEVSRRTILRDVDALGQIGVPVVSSPGVGGGLALADGYYLPPLHLTAAEAGVLLLALRGLGDPTASPFGDAGRGAEDKLRAALRPDVLAQAERDLDAIDIAPPRRPVDPAHLRVIRDAIERERWLRVEYRSLRRVAVHDLLPTKLQADDGRWYCRAVSLDAGDQRSYRVDRIATVTPIPTPERASGALHAAARPRRPYDDPTHPEVIVQLTYRGMRQAEDAPRWPATVDRIGADAWQLRFRCPPAELPYYAREIHALGPDADALSPPELRALVRDLAAATMARYVDDGR